MGNRMLLFITVLLIHAIIILGPAGCFRLTEDEKKNKEIAFRVNLGGLEPSTAPETGEPEKLRPDNGAAEPANQPEPVPEPQEPPKPDPEPPKPDPAEKQRKLEADRKKKLEADKKRKAEADRKKKLEADKKRKADADRKKKLEADKKRKADADRKKKLEADKKRKADADRKKRENAVHTDPNASKFDPNKKYGGTNFNKNIKIGKKDAGQKQGKINGRTPASGADKVSEQEWEKFSNELNEIISDKWDEPAGVLITEKTAAVIAIRVDRNGRVIGKKLLKPSPNKAVNDSAWALLKKLNTLAEPPGNSATGWIEITLIPE